MHVRAVHKHADARRDESLQDAAKRRGLHVRLLH
jgi:hypothetical protein